MGKKSKKKGGAAKGAKKEATAAAERPPTSSTAFNILDTMCKHGLDCSQLTVDSDAMKFTHSFLSRENYRETCVAEFMMNQFDEYIGVWNNNAQRQLAIDILLNHGTNIIIGANGEHYSFDLQLAKESAIAIILFEEHDGKCTDLTLTSCTHENVLKVNKLCAHREVVSFYNKRIKCECLKEKYKQLKKEQPTKLGMCENCKKGVDRSTLKACASCKLSEYCSKKCQREHWFNGHREECAKIVESQKITKFERATSNLKEKIDSGDKEGAIAELKEAVEGLPDSIKNMTMNDLFSGRG